MPLSILIQLRLLFAATVVVQTATALLAIAHSGPSEGAAGTVFPLIVINLFAAVLTYAAVRDRRWRAQWRAFQSHSPGLLVRLTGDAALRNPAALLAAVPAVPEEPANVYLEQPFRALVRWDRKARGSEWLDRPDAEQLIAVCALKLLTDMDLKGAYIGRTYHETDRVAAAFGAAPVRALRSRSRGTLPVYTFRADRERQHMVVTIAVKRDGNILTLGWHHAVLRATWLETISLWWGGLSLASVVLCPILQPFTLLYAFVSYPPGRGWTSMWAKVTRNRLLGKGGGNGESWGERMESEAFGQSVEATFRGLSTIQFNNR